MDIETLIKLREYLHVAHHIPLRLRIKFDVAIRHLPESQAMMSRDYTLPGIKNVRINLRGRSVIIEYDREIIEPQMVDALFNEERRDYIDDIINRLKTKLKLKSRRMKWHRKRNARRKPRKPCSSMARKTRVIKGPIQMPLPKALGKRIRRKANLSRRLSQTENPWRMRHLRIYPFKSPGIPIMLPALHAAEKVSRMRKVVHVTKPMCPNKEEPVRKARLPVLTPMKPLRVALLKGQSPKEAIRGFGP